MVENAKTLLLTADAAAEELVAKINQEGNQEESSHLNFLLQYKAVLDCIYLVSENECKKAHQILSNSLKTQQKPSLHSYLAKVYVEMAVHNVVEIEKDFALEVDQELNDYDF